MRQQNSQFHSPVRTKSVAAGKAANVDTVRDLTCDAPAPLHAFKSSNSL